MIKINLIEHLSRGRGEAGAEIALLGAGFGAASPAVAPTSPARGFACPGDLVPPRDGHGWHTGSQQAMSHTSAGGDNASATAGWPWLVAALLPVPTMHSLGVWRLRAEMEAVPPWRPRPAENVRGALSRARPSASRGAANCL